MSNDSRTDEPRSLTRRSTLQTLGTLLVGTGAAAATAAAPGDDAYTVVQGDATFAVEPISGDVPVEQFYSFRLPDGYSGRGVHDEPGGPFYESVGTRPLQRESTTITFLYDGPNRLSLVVVHDKSVEEAGDGDDGGSATWEVLVHEADAEWVVKDDEYWDTDTGDTSQTNYDNWNTDSDPHQIDWTWAAGGTDGGVLGFLGAETALLIDPSYNEQATLYGDHYEGDVTAWEFLGGSVDDPERVSLALDEPVAIVGPSGDLSAVTAGEEQGGASDETTEEESTEEEKEDEETPEKEDRHDDDGDGDEREDDDEDERDDEDDDDEDDDDDEREESLGRANGKAKGKKKGEKKGRKKGKNRGKKKGKKRGKKQSKAEGGIEVTVDLW